MNKIEFTDKNGTFRIHNPENYSGLYLPLAGETGLKSSITPNLGGDSKTCTQPFRSAYRCRQVSAVLHRNRAVPPFWHSVLFVNHSGECTFPISQANSARETIYPISQHFYYSTFAGTKSTRQIGRKIPLKGTKNRASFPALSHCNMLTPVVISAAA